MDSDQKESKFKRAYWPTLDSPAAARRAIMQAFGAALLVALVTAICAAFAVAGVSLPPPFKTNAWSFVDAAFFVGIAIGLWRNSRAAAWAALILYAYERIYGWTTGSIGNPVIAVIFSLAFVNGVRGSTALATSRFDEPASASPAEMGAGEAQALETAKLWWGNAAHTDHEGGRCFVGRSVSDKQFEVHGEGASWDEALADARKSVAPSTAEPIE